MTFRLCRVTDDPPTALATCKNRIIAKRMNRTDRRLSRQSIEKYQIWIYLAVSAAGLLVGLLLPVTRPALEFAVWPVLGLLLFVTFTQTPLDNLREAIIDWRLIAAATVGNFLVLPLLAFALIQFASPDVAIRLGLLLVLLAPCTDWFITFSHLGGADTKRAIALTPLLLLLQLVLLPIYLWLFLGAEFTESLARKPMLIAFVTLIMLPLIAAFFTQRLIAKKKKQAARNVEPLSAFPVPLLAIVIFAIAGSQVAHVANALSGLAIVLAIFAVFLVAAAFVAKVIAEAFRLPVREGRTLAFSLGTRNSFVVLPIALALPESYQIAVVVIVLQSLVELIGMAIYLWWIPTHLFRMAAEP